MQRGKLIKTADEIAKMTRAGEILAGGLREVKKSIKPGITGLELDAIFERYVKRHGGSCVFFGYQPEGADKPYPASICVSPNEVIVHGTPNKKPLKAGDIVSVDVGVNYQGYCADAAITVAVGKASPLVKKLIEVTRKSLELGIAAAKPGNTLGDIGYAIQTHITDNGFKVAKGLTGHGIGTALHEDPHVYNEGRSGEGMKLSPGMCLALEPMVGVGTGKIVQLPDDSYAIADGSLSAHFEHTIVITEKGNRILTA
ncbi:MAG: type I methionyl aminopeptidase [bacterium]|nr:type I methionyl aminopeptidase [bacterium]